MAHRSRSLRTLALVSARRRFNDLRVVAGNDVDPSGFTLLAILRNEMYFLPKFLAHYRGLGVRRFVFLNDRSDDGSREYLFKQSDTVVVESDRAYGDQVEIAKNRSGTGSNTRILYLWRSLLHDMFARERWALQVDLDEFVLLPDGMNFPEFASRLEEQKARNVWGVMLDVYPRDFRAYAELADSSRLDESAKWYFDGERHLRLRKLGSPRTLHPGARARLYRTYGVDRLHPDHRARTQGAVLRKLRRSILGLAPTYNIMHRPTLLKWSENDCFFNSHRTSLPASSRYLLPIQHYRFAGSLLHKVQTGMRERSYFAGSLDHRLLSELLRRMEGCNGSFLYAKSRPLESFEDLADTRNALGF